LLRAVKNVSMLSVIKLRTVMMNVSVLSIVMLHGAKLNVSILNVIMLSVIMPNVAAVGKHLFIKICYEDGDLTG
jgi:hypothetical protein